jgi:hypothetical protein
LKSGNHAAPARHLPTPEPGCCRIGQTSGSTNPVSAGTCAPGKHHWRVRSRPVLQSGRSGQPLYPYNGLRRGRFRAHNPGKRVRRRAGKAGRSGVLNEGRKVSRAGISSNFLHQGQDQLPEYSFPAVTGADTRPETVGGISFKLSCDPFSQLFRRIIRREISCTIFCQGTQG